MLSIGVASTARSVAFGAGDRVHILEISNVPGKGRHDGSGSESVYARIRSLKPGQRDAWVRRSRLSSEDDGAHSARETFLSPSLSAPSSDNTRHQRDALNASSSSAAASDLDESVDARSMPTGERRRWVPKRMTLPAVEDMADAGAATTSEVPSDGAVDAELEAAHT